MGLIGEGGKQGGEETNFSSSLAEATTEQRSHQGPAGKSKMVRKEIGNGESESEELKREANGGFDKAATNFSPFLALERKKGAKSSNERAVRGEEFLGFGLKGSPAKLKVIDKGTQSHNDADHKTSMDLNKNNVFKVDPAGFGLERQHGESEGRKVAVPLEGVEKAEGPLKELGEESGRIDRGVQGQEQAAQKSGVGQMKNSPEKFARKELRIEGSNPTLGTEPKDARPETTKAKVLEEGLAHKKIEKTELNSGENSNLSSRNYSTPDKGTGAISHSKEPHHSTKSSQTDTLKQIVTKAAFNLENGRSEFKIDLKPETLGHLKMQILTENHHVTVRILTESPLVKEMIESNLVQLKVNFQNQGLEIEKFDVSVALGSDKNGAGGGRYESKKMREKFADTDNGYGEKAEDAGEADNSIKRDQQESAVNLFV